MAREIIMKWTMQRGIIERIRRGESDAKRQISERVRRVIFHSRSVRNFAGISPESHGSCNLFYFRNKTVIVDEIRMQFETIRREE